MIKLFPFKLYKKSKKKKISLYFILTPSNEIIYLTSSKFPDLHDKSNISP